MKTFLKAIGEYLLAFVVALVLGLLIHGRNMTYEQFETLWFGGILFALLMDKHSHKCVACA